jgi:hypothetical protein
MMTMRIAWVLIFCVGATFGCSDSSTQEKIAAVERHKAVWLPADGLDSNWLAAMVYAGIDRLVIAETRSFDLEPLRLALPPEIELYAAVVDRGSGAAAMASSARATVGGQPAGVIVDHAGDGRGLAALVDDLKSELGVPIRLLVHPDQLQFQAVLDAAVRSAGVIVLIEGNLDAARSGAMPPSEPPWRTLEPLMDTGIPVAGAWVLDPTVNLDLGVWGDDPDSLLQEGRAVLLTSAETGFGFKLTDPVLWSGIQIEAGQILHLEWLDASALDRSIADFEHLPRLLIDGFHFLHLPPPAPALGLSRQGLLGYLNGEQPRPRLQLELNRRGNSLQIIARNPSVFNSAPSSYDNFVEIRAVGGNVDFRGEGSFDAVTFGSTKADGSLDTSPHGGIDTVRFVERYLSPGEEISTTMVRFSPANAKLVIRWQLILGNGELVGGSVDPSS